MRSSQMSRSPIEGIAQHLDKTDDPVLIILRAHLLVEERLRDILAEIVQATDELRAARLTFYQAMQLYRAVTERHDEMAWDFIARLSEEKNKIAHRLAGRPRRDLWGRSRRIQSDYSRDRLRTPLDRFRTSTIFTCGYLEAIRGSVRLQKAYTDKAEFGLEE